MMLLLVVCYRVSHITHFEPFSVFCFHFFGERDKKCLLALISARYIWHPNGGKINIKSNYRNEKLRSPFKAKGKQNGSCCVNFDWLLNITNRTPNIHVTSIGDEVIAVNCMHRWIDNVLLNTVDFTRMCVFVCRRYIFFSHQKWWSSI